MFNLAQNTPEWLAWRKDKIGASDAPVIMGDSPWCTPYKRWQEKLGLVEQKPQTWAMKRGIDNEQKARDTFRIFTEIETAPKVLVHPGLEWMVASMDGVSACGRIGIEIKCPGAADHAEAKAYRVPKKYYAQLQHQHAVGQFDKLYYASLGKDESFHYFEVPRDDEYIKRLIAKEKDFYECICNLESPSFHDSDFDLRVDADFEEAAGRWTSAKLRLKEAEQEESALHARLVDLTNGRPCRGAGVRVTPYMRKGSLDYAALKESLKIDLEPYRRASIVCWRVKEE